MTYTFFPNSVTLRQAKKKTLPAGSVLMIYGA